MGIRTDLTTDFFNPRGNKVRALFIVLGALSTGIFAYLYSPTALNWIFQALTKTSDDYQGAEQIWNTIPLSILSGLIGAFLGGKLVDYVVGVRIKWDKLDPGNKVDLFIGAFGGLVSAVPFLLLFNSLSFLPPTSKGILLFGVTVLVSTMFVYALQSMEDILPWHKGTARKKRTGIKILDTNVIIDGRIYDVLKTGFVDGQLYVPGFVLEELQYIADSSDALRRQRGKRGLEVLKHMQAEFNLEVRIHDKFAPEANDGVDSRLVRLAKAMGGDLVTNDHNLNRVAQLQDVKVLNLNDLALSVRPNIMPQETLLLMVIREGNQQNQGVGYLEDGTMVVIENGKPYIGENVEVTVSQVIQTERGKMIFAEVDLEAEVRPQPKRASRRQP